MSHCFTRVTYHQVTRALKGAACIQRGAATCTPSSALCIYTDTKCIYTDTKCVASEIAPSMCCVHVRAHERREILGGDKGQNTHAWHGVFFLCNLAAQNQDSETAWHCACGVVQAKVFRVVTLGEKERVAVCQPVYKMSVCINYVS